MSAQNDGGPAFPLPEYIYDVTPGLGRAADAAGMTLRDYFAAKAMASHAVALSDWEVESEDHWHAEIARLSYKTADAMLAARDAEP